MTDAVRPVVEGLFTLGSGGPALLGSRCDGCGAVYFPRPLGCPNPCCHEKKLTAIELPRSGRLISYTVQRYRPPPLFQVDDWAPYAVGLVSLGEGLEVMGMLCGFDLDQITIGSAVCVVAGPLYIGEDGCSVHTYQFAPETDA